MSRELADETVRRMVETVRPEWTVRGATATESGTDAVYYVSVETRGGPPEYVLKACTAVPPADFRPEPHLLALLGRRTSIPVPRVVGAVDEQADLPSPFFIMERCDGELAEQVELAPGTVPRMARAAGRYAGEYHDLGEFRRFGRLRLDSDLDRSPAGVTVDGRTLAVTDDGTASWRAWLEDLFRDRLADLDDRFVDLESDVEAFVEARLHTLDRPFDAALGHVDYKFWNLLVEPRTGETTAVLDWAHATAMAPYYDLVLTEQHLSRWAPLDSPRRRRIRTALEAGYAETNDLERDADFEERRELYLLMTQLQPLVWFSEWFADASGTERRETAAEHRRFVSDLLN